MSWKKPEIPANGVAGHARWWEGFQAQISRASPVGLRILDVLLWTPGVTGALLVAWSDLRLAWLTGVRVLTWVMNMEAWRPGISLKNPPPLKQASDLHFHKAGKPHPEIPPRRQSFHVLPRKGQ